MAGAGPSGAPPEGSGEENRAAATALPHRRDGTERVTGPRAGPVALPEAVATALFSPVSRDPCPIHERARSHPSV